MIKMIKAIATLKPEKLRTHVNISFTLFLLFSIPFLLLNPILGHLVNGKLVQKLDNFKIWFSTDPEDPSTNEDTKLLFSVQTLEGVDLENFSVVVSILKENRTIYTYSERRMPSGDFSYVFRFPESGVYDIVVKLPELTNDSAVFKVAVKKIASESFNIPFISEIFNIPIIITIVFILFVILAIIGAKKFNVTLKK